MAEQIHEAGAEPELTKKAFEPRGVLQKNLKPMLYLGAAILVILAAIFSSSGSKTASQNGAALHQPPQPMLQDTTDNNVQDLKNQVSAARKRTAQQIPSGVSGFNPSGPDAMPAQRARTQDNGPTGQALPCVPGQPCSPQPGTDMQPSPVEQQAQQLEARDRALAYDSRFASNLVFARAREQFSQRPQSTALMGPSETPRTVDARDGMPEPVTNPNPMQATHAAVDPATVSSPTAAQRRPEVNIDAAAGQSYVLYEGTTLDTVLMNRLDGDAPAPVKVLVSNPLYSHDRQHVLIPDGTVVLGEARKIGSSGFGQQRRLALVFHRMIMPDGYSVDLDQFHGLDQIGEEGVKDKVNNHYLQIFGTSIALGVIAGAGEIEQGGGTISTSGSQAFATGASSGVSESATTILDRFIQIPPTVTVREGHRVKVYFTEDMLLPAYERHAIPQTF
jgi:type IV secretion system protein VirB10